MASEKTAATDDQVKLLEEQLAQMRSLQERTEAQLAEIAREKADSIAVAEAEEEADEPAVVDEADEPPSMPEIRVIERADPADPPQAESTPTEKGVLGVLRRTIESVSSGQRDREPSTQIEESLPPARRSEPASVDLASDALASLEQKLDAIAESISAPRGSEGVTQEALEQVLNETVTAIQRHAEATEQQAQTIRSELHTIGAQTSMLARQMAELAAREEPQDTLPETAAPGDLETVICGEILAAEPSLAGSRHELIAEFMASDSGAMGLVGQLLLFHAAPSDRMPHLLRDIGEAFYRWRPQAAHAPDSFQQAMMQWLAQTCEQNGSANRIELVRPGDRYDATRHHAKSRGLEVSDVYGWVVLRDNGKVYTKAAVAVK